MKVLWVLKGFGAGGAERLLLELLPHMPDVSFRAVRVSPREDELAQVFEDAGLEPTSVAGQGMWDPTWIARLAALIRRERPDVVHLHLPLPAVGGRLAAIGSRCKVVYTEHGAWDAYRPSSRLLNALTFRLNDFVIAVSRSVEASIPHRTRARLGGRLAVVHNGIDVESIERSVGARGSARQGFGAVGHLTPVKGMDVLVRAAALVQQKRPDTPCFIVGDGPMRADLEALSKETGARVRLLGYRSDARQLMAGFQLVVFPSRSEGLPLALLEAIALGRPVVATNVGGVGEVIRDGDTGLLCPPEDPSALAATIERALGDPTGGEQRAQRARKELERGWDARRTAASLMQIYREVVATASVIND